MFTWICPKCGGEVPPAYDDCPRCAPKKSAEGPAPVTTPVAPATAPSAPAVQLPSFSAAPSGRAEPPPRRGLPASAVAVLAFGGIAALLAVLYLFVLPKQQQAATEPEAPAAVDRASTSTPTAPASPFAKHLEVTGIRLSGGSGGKLKVHYVVVNHSNASLPEMKMIVTLTSGDRNYFEFPATVPSLGPYEVKDEATAVTTTLKPYELPDWQMFRPKFRITE